VVVAAGDGGLLTGSRKEPEPDPELPGGELDRVIQVEALDGGPAHRGKAANLPGLEVGGEVVGPPVRTRIEQPGSCTVSGSAPAT